MEDGARQRDRDAFMAPRPYWATDEEYEAAQEEASRRLLERGWQRLIRAVEDENKYPSPEWLADLVAESVPESVSEWAREYLKGRLKGEITRQGHPHTRPANLHVDEEILFASTGGVPWRKAKAVWWFRRRWARYDAFEMEGSPRMANRRRLRFVESRGVWRLKEPQKQAAEQVARRLRGVSAPTLIGWHREVADRYGPDVG